MWKWFKQFVINLFKLDKFANLSLPTSTDNNQIEVKVVNLIPEAKFIPQTYSTEQELFKSGISKAHKELHLTTKDLEIGIADFFTTELPKEYKNALRRMAPSIIMTSYNGFNGNDYLFTKAYPIIKQKLNELGINDVEHPTPGGIFIATKAVTVASEKWNSSDSNIEVSGTPSRLTMQPIKSKSLTFKKVK